ncbi:pentapeptide repeat-containing protein [Leifsonia sp. F6_8S_P_1B]|uniref:Pentapeptide repeat-containing protein n=1 Tax=Leifsonia williamsii TaxID=3035919 RepID=A0ABT8K9J9_9MICO|nr:pentapeptide repeat-containing protein [Leifsonia williamsii]MDN4614074.1 pentapeptide repeat-containing protein [Leifsonia williamsii]
MHTSTSPRELTADCSRCAGLCCVALAFAKSADFAFDKAAGEECVNLDDGFRCRIHPRLRDRGFKGCTVFDCFGAGQHVTQSLYGGATWRDGAEVRDGMFAVFPIVRQLHELLFYLREALTMPAAASLHPALRQAEREVLAASEAEPALILALDIEELRAPAAALLRDAARLTRETLPGRPQRDARATARRDRLRPGADLLGADLRTTDLRGAELRGALLIAADLRGADLTATELIGADLRDARVDGADLTGAIYLTQLQVNAARGDAGTRLPAGLTRPSHWTGAQAEGAQAEGARPKGTQPRGTQPKGAQARR